MQFTLELPEDIAQQLEASGSTVSRTALEALALQGYQSGALSESQGRRLLGFGTRYQVHGFLKQHGVPQSFSDQDLKNDLQNAKAFGEKWLSLQTHRP